MPKDTIQIHESFTFKELIILPFVQNATPKVKLAPKLGICEFFPFQNTG
jgi:hypothetical protein